MLHPKKNQLAPESLITFFYLFYDVYFASEWQSKILRRSNLWRFCDTGTFSLREPFFHLRTSGSGWVSLGRGNRVSYSPKKWTISGWKRRWCFSINRRRHRIYKSSTVAHVWHFQLLDKNICHKLLIMIGLSFLCYFYFCHQIRPASPYWIVASNNNNNTKCLISNNAPFFH